MESAEKRGIGGARKGGKDGEEREGVDFPPPIARIHVGANVALMLLINVRFI